MNKDETSQEEKKFKETAEPPLPGKDTSPSTKPIFVIQKHDASRLHYDFRLEVDGTLKSWVIPKGPSTDPSQKRLAIPTDDHPIEYADFEGIISEDNYGAGTVMIWDRGTYKNIKTKDGEIVPMIKCYDDGQIEVELDGKKIKGGYALIKTDKESTEESWLLIKMKDDKADTQRNPTDTETKSVKTGRSLQEIAEDSTGDK